MLEAHRRLPRDVQQKQFPQFVEIMDDLIATCANAMEDGSFEHGDAAGLAGVLSSLLVTGVEDLVAAPEPAKKVPAALDLRLRIVRHGAPGRDPAQSTRAAQNAVPSLGLRAG
jgi:hypothetical protein